METPLVSIIVPAFNCASYIEESIRSALDQDYPNKEIIVVDDGSTDKTLEVLKRFQNRIILLQQTNSGGAAARNKGIKNARGDFVAFLDADDYWFPKKLSRQMEFLQQNPEVGAVYCTWREWLPDASGVFKLPVLKKEDSDLPGIDEVNSGWLYNKLILDCIVHTSAILVRRNLIDEVGFFDEKLKRGQDYEYWFRLSRLAPIVKLKAILSLYRLHPESITHKAHAINYPYEVITRSLSKWGPVGPDGTVTPARVVRQVLFKHLFNFGYLHLLNGDPYIARGTFIESIKVQPTSFKAWKNLIISFFSSLKAKRQNRMVH